MSELLKSGGNYPPYVQKDMIIPGYTIFPPHQSRRHVGDSDSEYDSDHSNDSVSDYTSIDNNGTLGHAISVWTYLKPDSISLFTPATDDTLFRVVKYAEHHLGFNHAHDRIMVMLGGESTPKEMKDIYTIKPGSVVMVMPRSNITVNVEISQLKTTFPVSADPMCSVYEIKSYIKRTKGIPVEQQDILYRDKVLENALRLYEYRIRGGTTLHVLIQVHFDLLVNIETFWGKIYRLYVDRCSTGSDLIYTIFGRTFSRSGPEHVTVHELFVPTHVLLLQHMKRSIHWDYCLGMFGVKNGDNLMISTVGKESHMSMQVLKILSEHGETYDIEVSQFDRWAIVAFILHGRTDVPVDMIRLYKDKVQVNFTSVIGEVSKRNVILMNIVMTNIDGDITFGIPLKISLGNGIVENIKMAPSKKVRMVKKRLELMGVPNATLYELVVGPNKLPNGGRLQDVIYDLKSPMFLMVEKFPIFIHGPDGTIYKTMLDVNHTMKDLKQKIQMKTGHAVSNCRLLLAGQDIKEADDTNLYSKGFSTRTSIFVQTSTFTETFFITKGNLLIKIKLPLRPTGNEIKKTIWECQDIPEGSITCLQTFFFWYFHPRINKKFQFSRKKMTRKRLPAAHEPLVQASDRMQPRKSRKHPPEDLKMLMEVTEVNYGDLKDGKQQGIHKYKPAFPRHDKDDNRTWPLQHQANSARDVENWVHAGHYHDINRHDITLPAAPEQKPDRKTRKYQMIHHMTPRWMGSLLQRSDQNRLAASDGDIVMGRGPSRQPEPQDKIKYKPPSKRLQPLPTHHQGDATTTKYFHRRLMYDNQQLMYASTDDSDGD